MSAPAPSSPVCQVAVLGRGLAGWGGGVDLLRLFLNGLCAVPDPSLRLTLLLPGESWSRRTRRALRQALRALARRPSPPQPLSTPALREAFAGYAGQVAIRFYTGGSRGLRRALRALRAEVVLPCMDVPRQDFAVPWIGYLYDFQHRHLPELFTAHERERRDAAFAAMFAQARSIVVTSRAVADDAARFYPASRARLIPLPFSAALQPQLLRRDPAQVRAQFGVPQRYFILCNQFWVHKDHRTAFLAFAQLLKEAPEAGLALVCTGSLEDHRAPGHAGELRALLGSLGIADRVQLLGYIAKPDQIALMRGAIALLQPTLFEGGPGGGSTYDAVALGVPVILSDIPVNREVEGRSISYFPPQDAPALSARMAQALDAGSAAADPAELAREAALRLARLGSTLQQAIGEAVLSYR
ncbi:MAG TPA: glycosyltransferase [Steroidobacteraceae bacterium]|nr:glycosyltransferase [Steroidobacteraceae bacterium]